MPNPDDGLRSAAMRLKGPTSTYSLHPLEALDGVLIYVSANGETIGVYFGPTEEAAAAAVAADLLAAQES